MIDSQLEVETKRGTVCDLCGRGATGKGNGRIFSFTGASWIKLHGTCLAWMNLRLSSLHAEEKSDAIAKSRPRLRLVSSPASEPKQESHE